MKPKSMGIGAVAALLALLLLAACTPVAAPPSAPQPDASEDPAAAEMMRSMTAALTATPWQWTQFVGGEDAIAVETPAQFTVRFNADGTLAVTTDCQERSGSYAVDGAALAITFDDDGAAGCAEGTPGAQLLQGLGKAVQFVVSGNALFVGLEDEAGTLAFQADATTALDLCGEGAAALNAVESTLAPEVTAGLDQALAAFLDAGTRSAPGVALLVDTPAGRYFKAAGVADVTTCAPLAADSPYEIGSNTKLMTAAMILQLHEEGALSLDDPLAKWLPDLAAVLPYGDAITLDMLLRHTSGLYDYFDVEGDGGPIANGTTEKAMLTRAFTPEELVQRVAAAGESYFAPDAPGQFHYSNTGYILLGLIIEQAAGKSYAANLQERILDPLGLTQTFLLEGKPEAGLLPRAYYSTPFAYTTDEWNASQGWAAGAVVSTAEEFALFLQALFTGQLFQDAATLDLMRGHSEAGVDALGPGTNYGRGMLDNNGVLGHGGQTLGFQSDGGYVPGEEITIVMWSNSAANAVNRLAVPGLAAIVRDAGSDSTSGDGAPPAAENAPAGDASAEVPADVAALQAIYGPPSQAGFGSAVFYEPDAAIGDLPAWSLEKYKTFTGDLWDRYGEEAWLGPWRQVYWRPDGAAPDIVAELRSIDDPEAAMSVEMILDNIDDPAAARAALAAVFDDPAMHEVVAFNLGDGAAMSGVLVAGRRTTGKAVFLLFLLD